MPADPVDMEALSARDAAILAAFVAHGFDLAATAASLALTPLDLLAWYRRPAAQEALAELEALEDQAARLAHLAARRDAIAVLHDLARNAPDPLERRRAATALIARSHARGTGTLPVSARPRAERATPDFRTASGSTGGTVASPASALGADPLPDLHRLDPRSPRPHTGSPARSDAAACGTAACGAAGPAVSEDGDQPPNFAGDVPELACSPRHSALELVGDPVLNAHRASLLRTGCISFASNNSS
jgi:hypothetical protein